jgi:hypothetical protein
MDSDGGASARGGIVETERSDQKSDQKIECAREREQR